MKRNYPGILFERYADDIICHCMSAGRLVDVAHAEGGPWHYVVSAAKNGANIGLRIPDKIIVERHTRQKVSVTPVPRVGEPNEDSPFI